jgi:hypothetical protein
VNAPTRSTRARVESDLAVYWAGPGHPLGWIPGHRAYEAAWAAAWALEHVTHWCDLRGLREAVRAVRGCTLLLLDAALDPGRNYATRVASADDPETPPHAWPEGWEVAYSLCVNLALFDDHVLPALPDVERARLAFHGPRNAFTITAGDAPTAIVMPYTTCVYEHCRNDGRYYEGGVAHECPARDCVMGRLYGWEWSPPVPPRLEPMERGTPEAPLVHRFYRDGRP